MQQLLGSPIGNRKFRMKTKQNMATECVDATHFMYLCWVVTRILSKVGKGSGGKKEQASPCCTADLAVCYWVGRTHTLQCKQKISLLLIKFIWAQHNKSQEQDPAERHWAVSGEPLVGGAAGHPSEEDRVGQGGPLPGMNCIKIGLPGKRILSKIKDLQEILFSWK